MTRRSVALALICGIAGVVIGRITVPRTAPSRDQSELQAHTPAPAARRGCDRELNATKTQLAICMAYQQPKTSSDEVTEDDRERERERVRRNREVMATCPNYLVVQNTDGSMGLYPPEEWDGDGLIVARKLPSGEIGWYAGPDAGPRSDPSAFRAAEPGSALAAPVFGREADGTITVNGKPGNRAVQRMFGGKDAEDSED